jgi:hypothetical protein
MQQSLAAFSGLTAVALVLGITESAWFAAAALLAMGAGTLFVAHIVAFAIRRTRAKLDRSRGSSDAVDHARRAALPLFASSLGFAALLTAIPTLVLASEANCPYCAHGHCYNPATDECVCKARTDEKCCYSQTSTWRCLADQRCSSYNGDCDPL